MNDHTAEIQARYHAEKANAAYQGAGLAYGQLGMYPSAEAVAENRARQDAETAKYELRCQEEKARQIRAGALEAAIRVECPSSAIVVLETARAFEAFLRGEPQRPLEEAGTADTGK